VRWCSHTAHTLRGDAFISYSHAQDKPIASALQSVLQRLGKPWYKRRSLRVFRDDTSLQADRKFDPSVKPRRTRSPRNWGLSLRGAARDFQSTAARFWMSSGDFVAGKPASDHSVLMWYSKDQEPPPFPEESARPKLFKRAPAAQSSGA
jgi:hypothetical protein